MPVLPATQSMFAQRYAALADSITHGHEDAEHAILAPRFSDHAKIKLTVYQYDPLTVQVLSVTPNGEAITIHAEYVGVHGKSEKTIDRWLLLDGSWRLAQRD